MTERVANWPNTEITERRPNGLELCCGSCGFGMTFRVVLPPAQARQRAVQAGWTIDKKWHVATCPTCTQAQAKEDQIMAEATDKRPFRQAFQYLLEHYDTGKSCYHDGWNDGVIATAIGRSPKFVAKIRDEHFGPAEDPRLGDLREQIMKARADAKTETDEIRALANEAERKMFARLDEIGTQLAKLQK